MSATLIATRNVSDRVRGFLASSLLEVGPGVYFGAKLSSAVRDRIWNVLQENWGDEIDASVVMVWRNPTMPGEHSVRTLGTPPVDLVELDGMILTHRPTSAIRSKSLSPSDLHVHFR